MNSDSKTILFLISTANQAASAAPVREPLNEQGYKAIAVGLDRYFNLPVQDKFQDKFDDFLVLENPTGINELMWNLSPDQLREQGKAFWGLFPSILASTQPAVLVTGNDRGYLEQMGVKRASMRKIPTLLLQDGLLNDQSFPTDAQSVPGKIKSTLQRLMGSLFPEIFGWQPYTDSPAIGYGLGSTSLKALSDPWSFEILKGKGVNPGICIITGQPRFDSIAAVNAAETEQIRADLATMLPQPELVLFATQAIGAWGEVDPELYGKTVRAIFIAMGQKASSLGVVVRPHPSEDPKFYQNIITELELTNAILYKEGALHPVINACDSFLTGYSTTALEAIILGKPVLLVNPFGVEQGLPYASEGAAVEITSLDDLDSAVTDVFLNPDTRNRLAERRGPFLEKYVGPVDGKAARRVADVILRLAEG